MKLLTLMRHAKSSRDDPGLKDFDRPLAERGRREAPAMGAFLKERGLAPDCVLSSPSTRTRETLEGIEREFAAPTVEFPRRLYNAPPDAILDEIRAATEPCAHLFVIGHNPGINILAVALADPARSDRQSLRRIKEGFKSGAVAHFEFDVERWAEIAEDRGALRFYAAPKDLMG